MIDGGGARSFSQLEIMRAIMYRLKWEKYPNEPDKIMLPCEHFDLIGGSGTGGYAYLSVSNQRSHTEQFDCHHVS
jgi:patatin-like phospholipase/acyl hydrolase